MTVSSSINIGGPYATNGVTAAFAVPYRFLADSHLKVVLTLLSTGAQTILALTTNYTVSGAGAGAGGSITTTVIYATGYSVTILREVPDTQLTAYVANDPFPSASHERAIDQLTMRNQQLAEAVSRAALVPPGSAISGLTLDPPGAGLYLRYKLDGSGIEALGTTPTTSATYTASGTGAVTRAYDAKFSDFINARDFGVIANGVADDSVSLQAAINASYGKTLRLPGGTMKANGLAIAGEISIVGDGYTRSIVQQKAGATGVLLTINSVLHTVLKEIDFAGVATGAEVIKATGTTSGIQIINCLVVLAGTDGISIQSTDNNTVILNTIVETCGRDGVVFGANATSGSVIGCRLNVNTRYPIYCNGNTGGPGHRLIGNAIGGGTIGIYCLNNYLMTIEANHIILQTGAGIKLEGSQFSKVNGNTTNSNQDGILLAAGATASSNCAITGNVAAYNSRRGISLDTSPTSCTITGNVVSNNGESGVRLYKASGITVADNIITNNGISAVPKAGIYIDDGATGAASNNRIIGNLISDLGAGSQLYGIVNAASAFYTIIIGNTIAAATEAVSFTGGSILAARDNKGYVTQNRGTATIASGATSIVVAHGLDVTPAGKDFALIQTLGPSTAEPGQVWIDTIGATNFTIRCRTNPGASGANFAWNVSAY